MSTSYTLSPFKKKRKKKNGKKKLLFHCWEHAARLEAQLCMAEWPFFSVWGFLFWACEPWRHRHCCFSHFLPMDQLGRASRKLPISVGLGYFCLMQDSRILRCPAHLQKTRKTNPARERDAFNNCTSQCTGVCAAAAEQSQLGPLHLHLYISITKLRPSARKPS